MLKIARKHDGLPEDEVKEIIDQVLKEITQQ